MRVRAVALAAVLLALIGPAALAEVRLRAGVEVYQTLLRDAPEDWRLVTAGLGTIALEAEGSRNVRGELSLSIPASLVALPAVDRAFVRFRLPGFRMTIGAAPLSWGEGLLINAGDFPNGAYDPTVDLLSGDFRADAIWQTQLYIPLGPFSFVEAAILPGLIDPTLGTLPELADTRVGGRAYVDADAIALQLGYLYDDPLHQVYTSLHGSLWADLYITVAHEIDSTTTDAFQDLLDSIVISVGAFSSFSIARDVELAVRVEGQLDPADLDADLPSGSTVALTTDLTLSPTVSAALQSVVVPTDPSALVAGSVSWNLDQGLTLLAFVQGYLGDADAVFSSDASGGISFTAGARYVY